MRKIIFSIFIAGVLASCGQNNNQTSGQEVVSVESAPKLKFEKEVYDFGKIKAGEKVVYDFELSNTGKTPLIIKSAVASCGCTVPEIPKDPILTGSKSKINVVFNSEGKEGLQDKVITVTANTIPAQTQIHLIGEVIK